MIDQLGLLQLDSVNVLSRAHYLPAFSRLGPYQHQLLDELAWGSGGRRELFEYWAHEASLLPFRLQPLLRWRMARASEEAWGMVRQAGTDADLMDHVREAVRAKGPARVRDLELVLTEPDVDRSARRGLWNWDHGKRAVEFLFWNGELSSPRRVNFERHYDLTDRVVPAEVMATPTPSVPEAHQALLRVSAQALGVATEADLRDYFRLPAVEGKAALTALVDAGELEVVAVEGWSKPAYLWPDARRPRRIEARALLSPFDSMVFFRDRVKRLFDFHYRIEIYTPAHKRIHGYYVLPFLLDEALVARVDLKADRSSGTLLVQAAYLETGHEAEYVAAELAAELHLMAGWLSLTHIEVRPAGDLAPTLLSAVAAASS